MWFYTSCLNEDVERVYMIITAQSGWMEHIGVSGPHYTRNEELDVINAEGEEKQVRNSEQNGKMMRF